MRPLGERHQNASLGRRVATLIGLDPPGTTNAPATRPRHFRRPASLLHGIAGAGGRARAAAWGHWRAVPGRQRWAGATAVLVTGGVLAGAAVAVHRAPTRTQPGAIIRPAPGPRLCPGGAESSLLTGPSRAPAGAVTLPAGDNASLFDQSFSLSPNTTYYLASGTHTLSTSLYGQFQPQSGDTFIGAPGAVLDGERENQSAFDGKATNVTIEYLTVEDFLGAEGQMVVNHDGGAGWTIEYNTIAHNGGAGVGVGTDDVVAHNCLEDNDEYGFNSFAGSSNVTVSDNEIGDNNTNGTYDQGAYTVSYSVTDDVATVTTRAPMDLEVGGTIIVGRTDGCTYFWCTTLSDRSLDGTWKIKSVPSASSFTFDVITKNVPTTSDSKGTVAVPDVACGCSGGGKFWDTAGATVTGNYVHGNGFVGIWADTDNSGFTISGNDIADNWAEGLVYEISYNAAITDNTFLDNAWGQGPSPGLGGFPDAALYISESGSDSRVAGFYGASFAVAHNAFVDNWGGVVIYENANRACGITNDALCTLVNPGIYTLSSCGTHIPDGTTSPPDYVDNCRWKAQNVSVTQNVFSFTPSAIGPDCTARNFCGYNGLFSVPGTTPSSIYSGAWPAGASYPYAGYTVPADISDHQNNSFTDNTYCAGGSRPWGFIGFAQGNAMSRAQWTTGEKNAARSGDPFHAQDAGSTFRSNACSRSGSASTTITAQTTSTIGPHALPPRTPGSPSSPARRALHNALTTPASSDHGAPRAVQES